MKPNSGYKPVLIWVDDSVAQHRDLYEYFMAQAVEEAENRYEALLFKSSDDAIPYIIDNAHRIFMFIQDSSRLKGDIIPAWKKVRQRPGPSLGMGGHPGDFYTYVIDAFSPQAGTTFAGYSFGSDERSLINLWAKNDTRIVLADKLSFWRSTDPPGGSAFAKIALSQLDRWQTELQSKSQSEVMNIVSPLVEEMTVLCGVKPERLDSLTPRQFEELIASLFRNHGFDVELTSATCDGGYDIVAAAHSGLKKETMLVEVKHFAPHRPVGVGIIRALYGVKSLNKASKAMLVTSSYVSQYAKKEFSRVIPWELDFVERKKLIDWCRSYVQELLHDDENTEQS